MFVQTRPPQAVKYYNFLRNGLMLSAAICSSTYAAFPFPTKSVQPLSAEQAFQVNVAPLTKNSTHVQIHWNTLPGYYLYENKFKLTIEPEHSVKLGQIQFTQNSVIKDDPEFGKVKVFYGEGNLKVPIVSSYNNSFTMHVDYQGCLENLLCYPPERISISIH
ncbi:MAG: protein-disulfide reductase DsbD N-terminal domain-containing protein [Pseudomonadota bacterium]